MDNNKDKKPKKPNPNWVKWLFAICFIGIVIAGLW